jgi:ketosteroid isomerase-like protein
MRRFLITAALCLCAAPAAAQQPIPTQTPAPTPAPTTTPARPPMQQPAAEKVAVAGAEQEVTRLSDQYIAALKGKDAAALERIWADDLTFVNSGGAVQTKAQRLADIKSGANQFDTLDAAERTVRVYGDTAVMTTLSTIKGRYGGQEVSGQFRVTQVLVRRGGAWQIVAIQMTRAGQQ